MAAIIEKKYGAVFGDIYWQDVGFLLPIRNREFTIRHQIRSSNQSSGEWLVKVSRRRQNQFCRLETFWDSQEIDFVANLEKRKMDTSSILFYRLKEELKQK